MQIAVTGRMGSGKTTIAELLSDEYNYKTVRISGKLKKIIRELELPYERDVLQQTGDFFRKFDEIVWVRQAIKESKVLLKQGAPGIVIDDVRYKNEQRALVEADFILIRVVAPVKERKERIILRDGIEITNEDWKRWSNHPTELEIESISVTEEIENSSTINNFKEIIRDFISQLEK